MLTLKPEEVIKGYTYVCNDYPESYNTTIIAKSKITKQYNYHWKKYHNYSVRNKEQVLDGQMS